jgi:hypothetical protein
MFAGLSYHAILKNVAVGLSSKVIYTATTDCLVFCVPISNTVLSSGFEPGRMICDGPYYGRQIYRTRVDSFVPGGTIYFNCGILKTGYNLRWQASDQLTWVFDVYILKLEGD